MHAFARIQIYRHIYSYYSKIFIVHTIFLYLIYSGQNEKENCHLLISFRIQSGKTTEKNQTDILKLVTIIVATCCFGSSFSPTPTDDILAYLHIYIYIYSHQLQLGTTFLFDYHTYTDHFRPMPTTRIMLSLGLHACKSISVGLCYDTINLVYGESWLVRLQKSYALIIILANSKAQINCESWGSVTCSEG